MDPLYISRSSHFDIVEGNFVRTKSIIISEALDLEIQKFTAEANGISLTLEEIQKSTAEANGRSLRLEEILRSVLTIGLC